MPDATGARILSNGASSGTDPGSISWGTSTQVQATLGSDESLGGALLTPVPWLRNQSAVTSSNGNSHIKDLDGEVKTESTETIDGPNGVGSIETVSVSVNGISSTTLAGNVNAEKSGVSGVSLRAEGGVTQGELLRQEQRAGVVPVAQLANVRGDGEGEEDEAPHARGPEEIGMEDMGPQAAGTVGISMQQGMQGIDVEAAVGRRAEGHGDVKGETGPTTPKRDAEDGMESANKRVKDDGNVKTEAIRVDPDEMVVVDVDGRSEEDGKVGEKRENVGADTVDTSTL